MDQPRQMPKTRWSVVVAAGGSMNPSTRRALSTLFSLYQYPLYAFVRARVRDADKARDLTQSFFLRLLESGDLADVTPERGQFRSWLRAAMEHHMANQWDKERTQKRGGGVETVSLDLDASERRFLREPQSGATPEQLYLRCWTQAVMDHALARLREQYALNGQGAVFDALKGTISSELVGSYAGVGRALGKSEDAIKQAAARLKSRYRALLLDELRDITDPPDSGPAQLRDLMAALS
jgi:RNA polymerase sigma factor (sigma-70 family)